MIIIVIIVIIIATVIYLNVILDSCNAILSSACIWRSFRQKIAGAVASFALPPRVLQKGVFQQVRMESQSLAGLSLRYSSVFSSSWNQLDT